MTDGFRSRVPTNVVAVDQRDPAAFRSGVAEGLMEVGGALGQAAHQDAQVRQQVAEDDTRIAKIERDRHVSATVADRMGAWPDTQLAIQNKLDDLKNSWSPAKGDYQTQADQIVTDGLTGFKETLGADPEVVERFAPLMATFGASTRQGERRWAIATTTKAEGAAVDTFAA